MKGQGKEGKGEGGEGRMRCVRVSLLRWERRHTTLSSSQLWFQLLSSSSPSSPLLYPLLPPSSSPLLFVYASLSLSLSLSTLFCHHVCVNETASKFTHLHWKKSTGASGGNNKESQHWSQVGGSRFEEDDMLAGKLVNQWRIYNLILSRKLWQHLQQKFKKELRD